MSNTLQKVERNREAQPDKKDKGEAISIGVFRSRE
jgi:hypothetical protein